MVKTIGNLISSQRIKLGLTQKAVADHCGVSEGTVSRWESGDIDNMRRDRIASLAQILRISPLLLLGTDKGKVEISASANIKNGTPEYDLMQAYLRHPQRVREEIIRRANSIDITFAKNVSRLLKASGDINGFMKETGLSFDTVGKFMQGEPVLTTPEEAERIAGYFKADIVEMFFKEADLLQEVEKIEELLDDEIVVISKDSLTRGLLLSLKKCVECEKYPSYEKTKEAIELMKAFTFDIWLHRAFELTSASFKKSYKKDEVLDVMAKEIYRSTKRLWEMYNQKSDSAADFAGWIMEVVKKAKESDSEQ